ncbi:hypothetical protein I316_06291 [Kwoniella heveanensis BCC8398]|uniref:Gfo/Idh/MocA-like oxidoreductase C-terminal domain-containing protein n=1 Tax=Kwoniella heveanensis BCC8398 TaxID=1296120 RepID=A0A1B9GMQ6_9TREE|nr:hypothetical protein I316_06291 [Kwoniella heveanensis BCC8398]
MDFRYPFAHQRQAKLVQSRAVKYLSLLVKVIDKAAHHHLSVEDIRWRTAIRKFVTSPIATLSRDGLTLSNATSSSRECIILRLTKRPGHLHLRTIDHRHRSTPCTLLPSRLRMIRPRPDLPLRDSGLHVWDKAAWVFGMPQTLRTSLPELNLSASGKIGSTYLIKSASNDTYDPTGLFVQYAKASGGIFIDAGIHDIDIARWLLDVANPDTLANPKKQVTSVYASGRIVRHPGLEESGDVDSALAIINFENGTTCNFHVSRTSMHGHDIYCEIYGTESKLHVNSLPSLNKVKILDKYGVRNETTPSFLERFKDAFLNEVNVFTGKILDGEPVPVTIDDAFQASQIAVALTRSLRTRQPVFFDEDGEPILG